MWTPAARVIAAKRAGVTDGALVTASMLLEAGISAVAGVIVFVVSLAWVKGVDAPVAPLVAFAVVVAVLLHPRVFRPLASKVLRRFGYDDAAAAARRDDGDPARLLLPARGSSAVSRSGSCCARSARIPDVSSIVFLGGVGAVGAIVAVLSFFAPSGLGPREASMYGLMLAVAAEGRRSAQRC